MTLESHFPPIEFREVEKDVNAAHHEIAKGNHIDPMADTNIAVVPMQLFRNLCFGPFIQSLIRSSSLGLYLDAATERQE
jgi:hypothetical protein